MSEDQRTPIPRPNRRAPINRARLRRLRIEAGLNPFQLAEKAGISGPHAVGVENGKVGASANVVGKIARALDVPIPELLLADDEQDPAAGTDQEPAESST